MTRIPVIASAARVVGRKSDAAPGAMSSTPAQDNSTFPDAAADIDQKYQNPALGEPALPVVSVEEPAEESEDGEETSDDDEDEEQDVADDERLEPGVASEIGLRRRMSGRRDGVGNKMNRIPIPAARVRLPLRPGPSAVPSAPSRPAGKAVQVSRPPEVSSKPGPETLNFWGPPGRGPLAPGGLGLDGPDIEKDLDRDVQLGEPKSNNKSGQDSRDQNIGRLQYYKPLREHLNKRLQSGQDSRGQNIGRLQDYKTSREHQNIGRLQGYKTLREHLNKRLQSGQDSRGQSIGPLQQYQLQLMLLEQENKKRLMIARQEQEMGNGMRKDGPGEPRGLGEPGSPPPPGLNSEHFQGSDSKPVGFAPLVLQGLVPGRRPVSFESAFDSERNHEEKKNEKKQDDGAPVVDAPDAKMDELKLPSATDEAPAFSPLITSSFPPCSISESGSLLTRILNAPATPLALPYTARRYPGYPPVPDERDLVPDHPPIPKEPSFQPVKMMVELFNKELDKTAERTTQAVTQEIRRTTAEIKDSISELESKYKATVATLEETTGQNTYMMQELYEMRTTNEAAMEELKKTNAALRDELRQLRRQNEEFKEQIKITMEFVQSRESDRTQMYGASGPAGLVAPRQPGAPNPPSTPWPTGQRTLLQAQCGQFPGSSMRDLNELFQIPARGVEGRARPTAEEFMSAAQRAQFPKSKMHELNETFGVTARDAEACADQLRAIAAVRSKAAENKKDAQKGNEKRRDDDHSNTTTEQEPFPTGNGYY